MATTNTKAAPVANPVKAVIAAAVAGKPLPQHANPVKSGLNAVGKQAPAAKPVQTQTPAPQAPLYVMGPWPVKAQGGNSIRAYCYSVAKALAKDKGAAGFTAAEYASALAKAQHGSTYKQPSAGWGTEAKPNGNAHSHANWFAHPKQGWLSPVA